MDIKKIFLLLIVVLACVVPGLSQQNYGDIAPGAIVDWDFTSRSFSTGAPTSLAGSPTADCFKDNGTTPASPSGITLSFDLNGVAGANNIHITTATNASFYSAGSNFFCKFTAGTVGGTSISGEFIIMFSIANRNTTIRKGVAVPNYPIYMLGPTGTGAPGKSPTCQISGDAGGFNPTAAVTEVSIGKYIVNLTAANTNFNNFNLDCVSADGTIHFRQTIFPQQ